MESNNFIKFIYLVCFIFLLCSCNVDNLDKEFDGKITTDGSTSMERVIGYLGEAYEELFNGVTVNYNPTGSSAGIAAVLSGRCDIGLSSRELTDDEKRGLNATVVAIDALAIVVNSENSVSELSFEQVKRLFTGEVVNWIEVGGIDAPVVLIGREANSGTRDGFETVTDTVGKCNYTQELTSSGDILQTVSSNPNAIGYISLSAINDKVKVIKIEGVEPTGDAVREGLYTLKRNFYFVTSKDNFSKRADTFLKFATSKEVKTLIEKAGVIPVKE